MKAKTKSRAKSARAKDGSNRGWQPGRSRLDGGLTAGRMSLSLTEIDKDALASLQARWGMRHAGDAIRRAIRIVADSAPPEPAPEPEPEPESGPDEQVCPTCKHWAWMEARCRNPSPEARAWFEGAQGDRDAGSGMILASDRPCPGWK